MRYQVYALEEQRSRPTTLLRSVQGGGRFLQGKTLSIKDGLPTRADIGDILNRGCQQVPQNCPGPVRTEVGTTKMVDAAEWNNQDNN